MSETGDKKTASDVSLQTTSSILMVQPSCFGFNTQTSSTNAFQKQSNNITTGEIQNQALVEFNNFIQQLRKAGITIIVEQERNQLNTPDAIFPNNWISFHDNGVIVLYPMYSPNRRLERNQSVIDALVTKHDFHLKQILDLSHFEKENKFLEGTGSMVLDRINKIAYACLSPRTNSEVLQVFCDQMGYTPVTFNANSGNKAIYHTNVMMSLGKNIAVICAEAISSGNERKTVLNKLKKTHREIVKITPAQMNQFAGNMLQVHNKDKKGFWIISATAISSLSQRQIQLFREDSSIISPDISCIEHHGGGSVRCMLAEIFNPVN